MATKPERHEATAKADTLPPLYEDTRIKPVPGTYPLLQPVPAISGKSYLENEQPRSMKFAFCPNPSDESLNQDWVAAPLVKCSDVPRLMREGFHWDWANVVREEGWFDYDFTEALNRQDGKPWARARHYVIKDLQKPLRWIATLKVFALKEVTAHQFDLNQLSRGNVYWAAAYNLSHHRIYNWLCNSPDDWFNVIYDDTPMEGWWPWPRKN
ncbi:hypothetical protein F5X98DRAFT_377792 [Xylaria grammica]|nr:hypothetical protein F5X98DRAFT_377792 [Xylaria grammica]